MIVVDASVAVKRFIPEDGDATAKVLLQRSQTLIAPDLVVGETLNVLRRKQRQNSISVTQFKAAARDLSYNFDRLVPSSELAELAVDLAIRLDHAVYDCAYLACAIQEKSPLITADDVLVQKAAAHGFQAHKRLL